MTPEERPPGAPGRRILEQPPDEGPPLRDANRLHLRHPGITRVALPLTNQAAAGLDLVIRERHDRIQTQETRQQGLIGRAPVLRCREQEACGLERCYGGRTTLVMVRRDGWWPWGTPARQRCWAWRPPAFHRRRRDGVKGATRGGLRCRDRCRSGGWRIARDRETVGRLTWTRRAMAAIPKGWACNRCIW